MAILVHAESLATLLRQRAALQGAVGKGTRGEAAAHWRWCGHPEAWCTSHASLPGSVEALAAATAEAARAGGAKQIGLEGSHYPARLEGATPSMRQGRGVLGRGGPNDDICQRLCCRHSAYGLSEACYPGRQATHTQPDAEVIAEGGAVPGEDVVIRPQPLTLHSADHGLHLRVLEVALSHGQCLPVGVILVFPGGGGDRDAQGAEAPLSAENLHAHMECSSKA
mmetsp:Transcript_68237/g.146032  ORF Transcript_68237/g.146032 Transcript_68237/m.146032 type:complete len:224 (-) Transcript_68237:565-1236(-)